MTRFLMDIAKVGSMVLLVGVILYLTDPANVVVFQALGIAIFTVGGTHLTRRLLFDRLDLQSIALKAVHDNNTAAAVIFTAIVFFLVAVMFVSLSVLK